jgi:hypothetical protein
LRPMRDGIAFEMAWKQVREGFGLHMAKTVRSNMFGGWMMDFLLVGTHSHDHRQLWRSSWCFHCYNL